MEKPLQLEVFTEILKPCICKIAGPPKNELSCKPDIMPNKWNLNQGAGPRKGLQK